MKQLLKASKQKLGRQRDRMRWSLRSLKRTLIDDQQERQALAAYAGLVHQAYQSEPFSPNVCPDLWESGRFLSSSNLPAFYSPFSRERENSSHHYGHDIQLKRYSGLPLVGAPLDVLIEHGLKVAKESTFESPTYWSRAFLCMGPLRARWVRERYGLPAIPIGPMIAYAESLLSEPRLKQLRNSLGSTLLVILAHSWDSVERRMDIEGCFRDIEAIRHAHGYQTVILLRHWKDPHWDGIPKDWLIACNGHRSNPWFLDSLRSLMQLSDGLASNAFGTHLGYGFYCKLKLHWLANQASQDLSQLKGHQAAKERLEWQERQRLSSELSQLLGGGSEDGSMAVNSEKLRDLLNPYWGFSEQRTPEEMAAILTGQMREGNPSSNHPQ
jgi:hypothetical protein